MVLDHYGAMRAVNYLGIGKKRKKDEVEVQVFTVLDTPLSV
jgi:hypothetical protein